MKQSSHGPQAVLIKGRYLIVLLIFALQLVVTTASALPSTIRGGQEYILVINSTSFREFWSKELYSQLQSQAKSHHLHIESAELEFHSISNSLTASERIKAIVSRFQKKPQMVVMIYDPAWLLCKELLDREWKDLPVLLVAPNPTIHVSLEKAIERTRESQYFTPIEEAVKGYNVMIIKQKFFFQESIALMKQLMPKMHTIAFISDDNYMSRYAKASFEEFCNNNLPDYTVDFLGSGSLSTDELLNALTTYSDQTGILYFSWQHKYNNLTNQSMNENLHRLVNGFTKSPIFTLCDLNIRKTEFAGGCFISASDHAETILSIANQVAAGVPLSDTKIKGLHERTYLNHKNLLYNHVPTSLYPSEAIYYDTPPAFIEQYRNDMIILVLIIIFAITMVVIRAIYTKKTKIFKEQDKLLLEQLQRLIDNMPIGYARIQVMIDSITQESQYKYIDINPAFESLTGCNRQNIIGSLHRDTVKRYPLMAHIVDHKINSFEGKTREGATLYLDKIHFHNLSTDILEIFCIDQTEKENILEQLRSSTLKLEATHRQLQLSMVAGGMVPTTWSIRESCFEYTVSTFDQHDLLITHSYKDTEEEYFALIHPSDVEAVRQICQEAKDGYRVTISIEYRLLLPEKDDYLWMQAQATTMERDQWGKALVMTGILTDIDKRKKMELRVLQAQQAEQEYKRQLQLSLVAGKMEITKWDIEKGLFYFDVTLMNDQNELQNYQHILNQAQYLDSIHPDNRDQVLQALEMTRAGKRINLQLEYRLKKKGSNEYEWVETQDFASDFNEEGTPTMLAGIRRNINKRKVLELKMLQAKAVQEEKNRQLKLSLIARQMVIANWDVINRQFLYSLYSIDDNGKLITTTRQLSEEESFEYMHPEDAPRVQQLCEEIRRGERLSTKFEYRSYFIFGNRESYLWTETHINPLEIDDEGRPTKMICVEMDIDQRKNLEYSLIRAKEEAEESNRLKSAFLANMSHEIRTPLNAIVGFSDLLNMTEEPEERAEYLSIIKNNNTLLLQLIDDILNISRIEAGKLDLDYSEINVHHLFCELEDSSNVRQKNPNTPIVFDKTRPEYIIYTDRHRVMQVISNFINNAMKFTPTGSIEIGYKMEDDQLIYMYVKDTGCGISEENCRKVFDRFVKLDTFKQGTGLGLSICSSLIEKMNGQIGVFSTEGEGSTFWIKLPTITSDNNQLEDTPTQQSLSFIPKVLGEQERRTILIAEDNASNFKLFESILKKYYNILHGWNGEEAVDLYKTKGADLILMDIKMPVMDGFEAIAHIRKISATVPIIAATASVFPAEQRKIRGHGFNDFIAKPINPPTLMEMIGKYLNS